MSFTYCLWPLSAIFEALYNCLLFHVAASLSRSIFFHAWLLFILLLTQDFKVYSVFFFLIQYVFKVYSLILLNFPPIAFFNFFYFLVFIHYQRYLVFDFLKVSYICSLFIQLPLTASLSTTSFRSVFDVFFVANNRFSRVFVFVKHLSLR